jgi:hypothetical protein
MHAKPLACVNMWHGKIITNLYYSKTLRIGLTCYCITTLGMLTDALEEPMSLEEQFPEAKFIYSQLPPNLRKQAWGGGSGWSLFPK